MTNVTFSLHPHMLPSKQTVEVRDRDGALLCTITQGDKPDTIRIVTKHEWRFDPKCGSFSSAFTFSAPADPPSIMDLEILR